MALLKALEYQGTGLTLKYWRIETAHWNYDEVFELDGVEKRGVVRVTLLGYVDEAARKARKNHVDAVVIGVPMEILDDCVLPWCADPRGALYEMIAGMPQFEGARGDK